MNKIQWKRQEVEIKSGANNGDHRADDILDIVRALVNGFLAVHKNPWRKHGDHDYFSVTHIQTGMKVRGFPSQRQSKRFVELVSDLQWDFTKPRGDHIKALWKPVQKAILAVDQEERHGSGA